MIALLPDEFTPWAGYIQALTGITLDATKSYLIENRLGELLRQEGCSTFSDLLARAKGDSSGRLQRVIVNLITTGETLFFRDGAPFELIRSHLLPELIERQRRMSTPGGLPRIRILSAACSTGQEVYSLAMVLKEVLIDLSAYDVLVMGIDISDQAISRASRGVYQKIELERGLVPEQVGRYFIPQAGEWMVHPELRSIVTFQRLNLLQDFSHLGRFDLILCRNVAIYFSDADRKSLFQRLGRQLNPGGALLAGSSEMVALACPEYQALSNARASYFKLKAV